MINPAEIQQRARELLENGEVTAVIGYKEDPDQFLVKPAFLTSPDETYQLTYDPTCVHNLSLYLTDKKKCESLAKAPVGPIAIVAKGCDSRSINVLLQENFVKRENLHVLGVSCEDTGVIDEKKLARYLKGKVARSAAFTDDGHYMVSTMTDKIKINAEEVMADRCLECRAAHPVIADTEFGEKSEARERTPFKGLSTFDESPTADLWSFWEKQMDKCIRCYACRSVCPMCYCDECVVDSISFAVEADTPPEEKANRAKWIERSAATSENFGYHIIRAMHLAGRCTDCGECERVCPVAIPLRLLNTKLEREAEQEFDYVAGLETDKDTLVSSFRDDDPNSFIR